MTARRPDDEPAGLDPEWAGVVVPDDISELDLESREVQAELYGTTPRNRLGRLFAPRRRRRYEPSGLLVLAVLVISLFIASLGIFVQPSAPRAPTPRPLANPSAAPGSADALLPDLALSVGRNGSVRLRTVRPAVVIVMPAGCYCAGLVSSVIAGTGASRLRVLLVGPTRDPVLPSNVPRSRVSAGTDTGGRLAAAYRAGPTPLLLFVRSDGTVSRVMHDAKPGDEVRQEIAGLAR